jgi:hypothetical protein
VTSTAAAHAYVAGGGGGAVGGTVTGVAVLGGGGIVGATVGAAVGNGVDRVGRVVGAAVEPAVGGAVAAGVVVRGVVVRGVVARGVVPVVAGEPGGKTETVDVVGASVSPVVVDTGNPGTRGSSGECSPGTGGDTGGTPPTSVDPGDELNVDVVGDDVDEPGTDEPVTPVSPGPPGGGMGPGDEPADGSADWTGPCVPRIVSMVSDRPSGAFDVITNRSATLSATAPADATATIARRLCRSQRRTESRGLIAPSTSVAAATVDTATAAPEPAAATACWTRPRRLGGGVSAFTGMNTSAIAMSRRTRVRRASGGWPTEVAATSSQRRTSIAGRSSFTVGPP